MNRYLTWTMSVLVVVVFALVLSAILQQPPQEAPVHLIVGDPISACAYPEEEFGPSKVDILAEMDGVRPTIFDEFIDWKSAKSAGYVECP